MQNGPSSVIKKKMLAEMDTKQSSTADGRQQR